MKRNRKDDLDNTRATKRYKSRNITADEFEERIPIDLPDDVWTIILGFVDTIEPEVFNLQLKFAFISSVSKKLHRLTSAHLRQRTTYSKMITSSSWFSSYFAGNSWLNCLKYLHENGGEFAEDACSSAVISQNLTCLKYLHEKMGKFDAYCTAVAAQIGNLEILQYLHEHGAPWHSDTCMEAALEGNLACIVYAHEHGCDWNTEGVIEAAATKGYLAIIKYVHEKDGT